MRLNANISSDSRLRYETIFLEWDNSEDNKDQQQQFSADNNVDITGETIIDF